MRKLEIEELKITSQHEKKIEELEAEISSLEVKLAKAIKQAVINHGSNRVENTTKMNIEPDIDHSAHVGMSNCD